MRYSLLLSLILGSFFHCGGQEFSYTQYNVKDGLAGSVVYCAAEDKDGFMWFGTEGGLSRFDGTHFRNFTVTNGLPDNEVIKLFVDSKNRVWIIPFRNSVCYYSRGELHNQDNDPLLRRLSITSEIIVITEDKYGNIILAEKTVIHIITPDQKIENITQAGDLSRVNVVNGGLGCDRLFNFFSRGPTGNYVRYAIGGNEITPIEKKSFVGMGINTTLLSPDLDIFQHTGTLYCARASGGAFALPMPRNLNSLSKVDDSLFTLNTTNGAFMYNERTGKRSACFLKDQSINAVARDSEGNLWFMSAGEGIFRIGSLGFRNVKMREGSNLSVSAIQNIDGWLYIGTERSLLWRSDLAVHRIYQQKVLWHANKLGRVIAIVPMDKKSVLLGTDGCLVRLDHLYKDTVVEFYAVKSITACKGGCLISSSNCVELCRYPDLKTLSYIWKGRSTCSSMQDSLFYIGTINGLYSVVPGGKPCFLGSIYPVFKTRISAMASAPDGTLWIGTSGKGMVGMKGGRLLYSLTAGDGLTSNICRTIFISGNDIWVGTDKGLNRVRMVDGQFRVTTFGSEDGLSSDIINTVYVNKDNVYVGSANGLTYFNIDQTGERSFCKLRITSVEAMHHTWGYDTSDLVLPHGESSIRVDYAGVSYRSAGDITYRYRLQGLHNNWQTTRETFLSYPTLPAGHYELEIIASNKFDVLSAPVRISFTVEKLLWERTWFIFLAGAVLAAGVWISVWLRIRQLHRKNAEKIRINNRLAELEQKSLRAQMNPHFIFNSLNSIQKYVMEKDILGANKFITDFSRLIRLTLEITSKSRISIEEEVSYISSYLELERARYGNTFQYEIAIAPGINGNACYIPTMLLQPYIENSIRHGLRYREDGGGMVRVQFMENATHLICIIEDNGVGRQLAQQYKSLSPIEYQSRGMTLTARRVEMMNQGQSLPLSIEVEDLETDDHLPAGTRVMLCFPLQYVKKN